MYGTRHIVASVITLSVLSCAAAIAIDRSILPDAESGMLWLGIILLILVPGAWLVRGLLHRAAGSAPPSEWRVSVRIGVNQAARVPFLEMVPVGEPESSRWQRVMWAPAFAEIPPGTVLTARVGGPRPFRRAVVELPDGTRLAPAGKLRRRMYTGFAIEPYVLRRPKGFPLPHHLYVVIPAGLCVVSAFLLEGDLLAATILPLLLFGYLIHLWGWYGGLPIGVLGKAAPDSEE
ncbi:hypothetical protein [Nonomuraea soli]|uniref:Uncharacterized protein n=1 Tax=Nonomuraea soli TaxID=1032476 RepID=A0A7W0HTB9_9ACTN|nr:hypothetical protein [Nonomuraea soli]MBA2894968.1 hypothetical protein [Nonomuraea soli]